MHFPPIPTPRRGGRVENINPPPSASCDEVERTGMGELRLGEASAGVGLDDDKVTMTWGNDDYGRHNG